MQLKYKVSYQNYLVHTTVQTDATWLLPQTTHPINSYSPTFHAHFLLQSQLRQLQFLAHIFKLYWTDYSNQTSLVAMGRLFSDQILAEWR